MSTFGLRAERAAALAQQRELDLLLVSNLVNVRYLGGFRGTNGLCLIGLDRRTFITDFRYVERARSEVPDYDIVRGKQDLLESVVDVLKESSRPLREYVLAGTADLASVEGELRALEERMAAGEHDPATLRRYSEAQARLPRALA